MASGSYSGSSSSTSSSSSSSSRPATPVKTYEKPKTTYIDYTEKVECKDTNEEPYMCDKVVGSTKKYFCKKKGRRLLNFQIIKKCKDNDKVKSKIGPKPNKRVKSQDF